MRRRDGAAVASVVGPKSTCDRYHGADFGAYASGMVSKSFQYLEPRQQLVPVGRAARRGLPAGDDIRWADLNLGKCDGPVGHDRWPSSLV